MNKNTQNSEYLYLDSCIHRKEKKEKIKNQVFTNIFSLK